jgi:hypothetical protein
MAKEESSASLMWIAGTLSVATGVFLGLALMKGSEKVYEMVSGNTTAAPGQGMTSEEVPSG